MKTSREDYDDQRGPDARVSETENLSRQYKSSDEADMIRMGKTQQTRVSENTISTKEGYLT